MSTTKHTKRSYCQENTTPQSRNYSKMNRSCCCYNPNNLCDSIPSFDLQSTSMYQPMRVERMSSSSFSNSKAFTSAMKALQDKIKFLELQNIDLTNYAKTLEDEKITYNEEINSLRTEKLLLQKQNDNVEAEKNRHLEQNSIDREVWRKEKSELETEIETLKAHIQVLANERQSMITEIDQAKSRLYLIEELMKKSKDLSEQKISQLKINNNAFKSNILLINKQHEAEKDDQKEKENNLLEILSLKQTSRTPFEEVTNEIYTLERDIGSLNTNYKELANSKSEWQSKLFPIQKQLEEKRERLCQLTKKQLQLYQQNIIS